MSDDRQREALCAAALRLEAVGLNSGTAGNTSIRSGPGLLITPTGIPAGRLAPAMMVEMTLDGGWQGEFRPSSEWQMHAEIYRAFPAAMAVVHAHPDHCVALSCLREPLPAFHYMIASFGGDDVRCSAYRPFGSPELAEAAVAALEDRSACLLANHGMTAFSATLDGAVDKAVKLEVLARQYALARSMGKPVLLDADELDAVKSRYKTYGQQPPRA